MAKHMIRLAMERANPRIEKIRAIMISAVIVCSPSCGQGLMLSF